MNETPKFDQAALAKLFDHLESISIWQPASVTDEPEVSLVRWQIFLVKGGPTGDGDTVHFIGNTGYEGRVCSAIQSFDQNTKRGVTLSGRIYELMGPGGHDGDAQYVWARWLRNCGNPVVEELTETYTGT